MTRFLATIIALIFTACKWNVASLEQRLTADASPRNEVSHPDENLSELDRIDRDPVINRGASIRFSCLILLNACSMPCIMLR